MASIHPFVFLADYRIVVCSRCRHACIGDEIERHLSSDQHREVAARDRRPIAEAVRALQGILRTQHQLDDFAFPEPTCGPIPALGLPWTDGVACDSCRYIVRSVKKIKEHCRKKHGWVNSRVRGGQKKHAEVAPNPWREGVQCQRFFPGRKASQYFEVGRTTAGSEGRGGRRPVGRGATQATALADPALGRPDEEAADEEPSTPTRTRAPATGRSPATPSPGRRGISRLLASAVALEKNERQVVAGVEDKLEPNPWVRRTGWAEHLDSFLTDDHMDRLRRAVGGPQEDEKPLQFIWDSFITMATAAQTRVLKIDKGAAVLFEMHREGREKPGRPFEARMEEQSWRRYCTFFAQLVMYLFRTWKLPKEQRPPYKLTWEQGVLARKLWEAAEDAVEADEEGEEVDHETLQKLNMKLAEALVDHIYHETPYENVLVSGLAVMGIREDNGWVSAEDYTMRYSALIKIARIVVVARSIASLEKEVAKRIQGGQKEEEALRWTESLHLHVRKKTDRFMVKSVAGVMDWLLTTRTYGLKIIYTTPADGQIQWDGDRISYHRIQFSMGQLRDAIYSMVQSARNVLGDALLLDKNEAGEHVGFPEIPWDALEDDWSDTRIGHSFLSDDRSPWPVNGKRWLAERISQYPEKKRQWFQEPKTPGGNPVREKAAKHFDRLVEQLRGRLLVLCHLTGGQPGRSTEILGTRYVNTRHGGTRNVMVANKMVCFITGYHKRYRETNKLKMVFRYLPREVGALVVWYLWLVLPFWQQLRSVMQNADHSSPFLFSESPVYGVMTAREKQDLADGADPFYDTPGGSQERQQEIGVEDGEGQAGLRYRIGKHETWSPDRMRRALGEHSTTHLGTRFTTSSWRHLAIAINRKYCYGHFEAENDVDGAGEDGEENRIEDEQAGHSTHVAEIIYAREMQEVFSTSTKRTKFLVASQTWHRFLGLGHVQGMLLGRKRLEPFEELSAQGRLKRQKRLAEVDLRGRLRQMLGDTNASFRPGQERVLQAIHRGYSPILQIVGTGGGKSLSFMLPAYCGGDGVTIVVVPLVALRDDMVRRCEEAGIQAYVWTASDPRTGAASVVFVTPESLVTKGFSSYITGLRATSRLDRVVVDECHMIMDSAERESRFRPAFLEIGKLVEEYGVQLIFLTATLAPKDELFFFQLARIPRDRAQIFRSRTTRANIQYRVREVDVGEREGENNGGGRGGAGISAEDGVEDGLAQEVEAELERARAKFPEGKIIIYCGTVQRTKALGARLGCPAYFNKAGTAKEKRAMLEQWIARGREITATNALGVGLDVPDIREVIHVTAPRRIRDFAQESGRAGRDGQASASVIIRQRTGPIRDHMITEPVRLPVPAAESTRQVRQRRRLERAMLRQREATARQHRQARESFIEDDMAEFLEGAACRRVVLDKVMDGTEDREDCLGEEQACDLCVRRSRGWGAAAEEDEGWEGNGIVIADSDDGEEENGESSTARDNLARQQAAGDVAVEARREADKLQERQWAKFQDWLPHWKGCCFICLMGPRVEWQEDDGEQEIHHGREECPWREDEWVGQGMYEVQQQIEERLFANKRLQTFSGCFHCGIPQEMCESWAQVWDDGGRFERRGTAWQCQMLGEPVRIMVEVLKIRQGKVKAMAETLMAKQGFQRRGGETEGDALFTWMGLRSIWAGHETNNLCKLLYLAVEEWWEEKDEEAIQ